MNNKRADKKNKFFSVPVFQAAGLLCAILLTGCEIALGAKLDLTGPVLEISNPNYMDNVQSVFPLRGTVYDADGSVEELHVTLSNSSREWRWDSGSWKTKEDAQSSWEPVQPSPDTYWNSLDGTYFNWSIEINLDNGSSPEEGQYTITAIAFDDARNSGANSAQSRVVVYDVTPPEITVLNPILTVKDETDPGDYIDVEAALDAKQPKELAVLNELLNGDFEFRWQITEDTAVRDLSIELADKDGNIYYENTLENIERNAKITILKSEIRSRGKETVFSRAIAPSPDPLAQRTYLQVITKSYDKAGNDEWKRNGWIAWDPTADIPWTELPPEFNKTPGETGEIVADSNSYLGHSYDDDGIDEVTISIYRGADESGTMVQGYPKTFAASGYPMSFQWDVKLELGADSYTITADVTDRHGVHGKDTGYFNVKDLSLPNAYITSPDQESPFLGDSSGYVGISGYATDNTGIADVYIAWVSPLNNPVKRSFRNKIYAGWTSAMNHAGISESSPWVDTDPGSDSYLSKVWKLTSILESEKDEDGKKRRDFAWRISRNDLGTNINGVFPSQEFVVLVINNNPVNQKRNVLEWISGRDISAPEISFDTVTVSGGAPLPISDDLNLAALSNSDTLVLSGRWRDDSVSAWAWQTPPLVKDFTVTWNGFNFSSISHTSPAHDGWITWTSAPVSAASITPSGKKIRENPAANLRAKVSDLAGNQGSTEASFVVETDTPSLARITSPDDNRMYREGESITINLDFNKAVTWTGGDPSLVLKDLYNENNTIIASYTGGKNYNTLSFSCGPFTVSDNIRRLDVKTIISGSTIADITGRAADMSLPSGTNSLGGGKNLGIDTQKPVISAVMAVSSAGSYGNGAILYFKLEASENINVTGSPALNFNNGAHAVFQQTVGGNTLLFRYEVNGGESHSEDTEGKTPPRLRAANITGGTITDTAGNPLVDVFPSSGFSAAQPSPIITIDTTAPATPEISGITGDVIYYNLNQTFALTGEPGAKMEYTINGNDPDPAWTVYTGPVSLNTNGDYYIRAVQTDTAGNKSPVTSTVNVTIDSGNLLTKISSPLPEKIYTSGDIIKVDLYSRKKITISGSPRIKLNINEAGTTGGTWVTGCTDVSNGGGTQWSFSYDVKSGDALTPGDSYLKVTAIDDDGGMAHIKDGTMDVTAAFCNLGNLEPAMRLENQKRLRILTGTPSIVDAALNLSGDDAKLTFTFDRMVYKGQGTAAIYLTQEDTAAEPYLFPAALTRAQYEKVNGNASTVSGNLYQYYTRGTNGTNANYEPDLSEKFILNYYYDTSNIVIANIFKATDMHQVIIPVASNAVTITSTGFASTVSVALSGSYAVPTLGAKYTMTLPSDAFIDEVSAGNLHDNSQNALLLGGVNNPVIRIEKEQEALIPGSPFSYGVQSITPVSARQPVHAGMKIDCQTPGVQLTYATAELPDIQGFGIADNTAYNEPWLTKNAVTWGERAIIAEGLPPHSTGDRATGAISQRPSTGSLKTYNAWNTPKLGVNQDAQHALKVRILALASKGYDGSFAYESANKTVLVMITNPLEAGDVRDIGKEGSANSVMSYISDGKERLWIHGGDSLSGSVSTPGFPLSWDNPKTGMRLMTGWDEDAPDNTTWYWVSWEITTTAYIGFVAGTADTTAITVGGPTKYSPAIEGWASHMESYVLYPGEKRVVQTYRVPRGGGVYINNAGRGRFGYTTTRINNR
ncbi:chitobiase/beta-hexosaminidase C-terminal domain-containing protein [Leadbettera azotonutricia]|uniref:Putative lipoprotein n=1 Tax=Leadbettera azotonutricia (strain ATCC BAA-888 / DSM 13862 / ZAS-9) TaxID=545695 RepID=F5Y732_LEAAZ|nr:chitobiase/beta-hexosaminidase C-terminal domain-containing protein [Leadbettera azotonutricia]AEF80879.1 putative lipoprotein [Leadbettera azotonutricia ZAS-9]